MAKKLKAKTDEIRREHILEAAIDAFARHGFRGATIRDIATTACVSDGTVYNSFENKDAILMEVLKQLLANSQPTRSGNSAARDGASDLAQMVARRWDGITEDVLSMIRIVWSEALINRGLGRRYRKGFVEPLMKIAAGPFFQERIAAGAMTEKDTGVASRLIVGSFLGLVLLRLLGDEVLNGRPEEFSQALGNMLSQGLLRQEATL